MEEIKFLVDRLSQYGFLVNLIPGTALCLLLELIGYNLIPDGSLYLSFFIFYFVGVVNNRFGSVFVEWFLKKIDVISFIPYEIFVEAESRDSKVSTQSMQNNMFRSYISVFILSLIGLAHKEFAPDWLIQIQLPVLFVCLLILFIISYKKQANYVKKRVEKSQKP